MKQHLSLIISILLLLTISSCEQLPEADATWQQASAGTSAAAISKNGEFALVSGYHEPSSWWDLKKNARLFNWRQSPADNSFEDNDPPYFVDISNDGSRALTASLTNFVVWDTETGESTGYYKAPSKIRSIVLGNNAKNVVIGLADGRSIFLSLTTGRRLEFLGHRLHAQQQQPPLPGEWIGINSVAISPNGQYVLSGGDDHYAILWNTTTGQAIYQWPHQGRVHFVKMTNDGRYAFTASSNAEAHIWDLSTGELVSSLKLKKREWIISSARFSNDAKLIATGSPGRDLKLWQVTSGELIKAWKVKKRFPNRASGAVVLDVAFTKDGAFLISEASSGFAQKWRLP